jgi:hypothetical protein
LPASVASESAASASASRTAEDTGACVPLTVRP